MMSDELETWECFQDTTYYDMWCVRRTDDRSFGQGFHLIRAEEAAALCKLLNTLHQPEAPDDDDLADEIAEAISDTLDVDWRPMKDTPNIIEIINRERAAARREGYEAAREEAAKVVDVLSNDYTLAWRSGHKSSSYLEGKSDGTEHAATAIRNMGE